MPLPLAYDCDDCDDVCCDVLFTLASLLAQTCADAVNDCLPVDVCEPVDWFVPVGFEEDHAPGDAVTVMVANVQDAADSLNNEQLGALALVRVDFVVRLLETGYPMMVTNGNVFEVPDPTLVHRAAKHSMGHMEAMLRAVRNGLRRPSLPMWRPHVPVGTIVGDPVPQPVRPIPPQRGLVGWTFTIGARVALGNLNPQ
jgi:hypothetical protein